jgi:hypothetical protein
LPSIKGPALETVVIYKFYSLLHYSFLHLIQMISDSIISLPTSQPLFKSAVLYSTRPYAVVNAIWSCRQTS